MDNIAIFGIIYFIGMIISHGFIGGIRDEMDGIGDMAIVIFWPIALFFFIVLKGCKILNRIGSLLGQRK